MTESPKKPRDIKDLKARLGRGAASGAPSGPASGAPSSPGSVPAPPAAVASVPIPGLGAPPGVAPPPFMSSDPAPTASAAAAPQRVEAPRDPFAVGVAPAQGPREVRLVVDERPVTEDEVGRASRGKFFVATAVIGVIALALGYAAGGMMGDRKMFNSSVLDGKSIYATVDGASNKVLAAQRHITAALAAATPAAGTAARIDDASFEALRAIEKPLSADAFSNKRYGAFLPAVVDDLFRYYNNVNLLWGRFEAIVARVSNPNSKAELTRAAQAASELSTTQYGCIPLYNEGRYACALGIIVPPETPPAEGEVPTTVKVGQRSGGRTVDRTVFAGGEISESNVNNLVLFVDTASSIAVLGQPASAFAQFRSQLLEIKQLLDETVEIQGRLITALGEIAKLNTIFAI